MRIFNGYDVREKFVALKSERLSHESYDNIMSLAMRRINVTKTF